MASNNDMVSKAVEEVLGTDETINLLYISRALDNINGEDVGTDPDYGMHFNYMFVGMSGQKLLDSFNSNFHAVDAQFLAHNNALQLCVMSNNIKLLREEDGIISYSSDGTTWKSLQSVWGKIGGNIVNQKDLQETLSKFALSTDVTAISNKVNTNSNSIILLQGDIANLTNSIDGMFNQINGVDGILIKINSLESMIATKVGSDNILKIRVRDGILEYTSDDNNWFPTQSKVSIEWGDIDGDIQNQADLINLINTISGGYDDFANQLSDLTTRLSIIEAKQVQQDIFNDEVSKKLETPTSHLTSAEYEDLVNSETVNINTLYIVDDTSPTYEE